MSNKRGNFSGKVGFILAAAGSAVGLGNLWRFPYLAAKYGGGIFLLVYLILTVTFGFALMTAEIAIGRKTGLSTVGAFKKLDKRFAFLGYMGSVVPMIILPYYCVIGGWVTKYAVTFITGGADNAATGSFFSAFTEKSTEPVIWLFLFVILTAVVVLFGVDKGIEKVSKILMPALVLLTIFISVYTLFLPGAMDGVLYYITPDFSHFSVKTVLAAMGQLFYSMSISMGIMVTYGSYLKKDVKELIDFIVDPLAEDEDISKLYDLWYEEKYKILRMYTDNVPPKKRLSDNEEFKSLKNDIIREALRISVNDGGNVKYAPPPKKKRKATDSDEEKSEHKSEEKKRYKEQKKEYYQSRKTVSATSVTRLFKGIASMFSSKLGYDDSKKLPVIDKRLRKEIEDKKNAEITMT